MSVRHAILALLSEGPKYGLQLQKEFESSTGDVWPLNIGQVYTTLQRLERDGLVESDEPENDGPQKGFHISEAGMAELSSWLNTPPDMTSPPRDELVIKVLAALRVPGVSVHDVIQIHRRYLVELMQQWTRLKEDEADFDISFALVVDAELFRLDSVVRWLDTADGRLKRAASEPPAPRAPRREAGWWRVGELPRAAPGLQVLWSRRHRGSCHPRCRPLRRSRRARRSDGPERLGQVDVAHHRRQPRAANERRRGDRRRIAPVHVAQRQGALRRRTIGYVFQDFNLLAGLTAVENVSLPLELDGLSARRPTRRGWSPSRDSGSLIGRRTIPTSSPVASANASRSHALWSASATCSLPTSRRARSTRRTARR